MAALENYFNIHWLKAYLYDGPLDRILAIKVVKCLICILSKFCFTELSLNTVFVLNGRDVLNRDCKSRDKLQVKLPFTHH